MSVDIFEQKMQAVQDRLVRLQVQTGLPVQDPALSNLLAELAVSLEELEVTSEELASTRQSLESEHQRYQALFEFAPVGYLVTDGGGVIQQSNQAAASLLKVAQEFLVGKPLIVFLESQARSGFYTLLTQLSQGRQPSQEIETVIQPRQGLSFYAELKIDAVYSNPDPESSQGVSLRWLLSDITQRKRAEVTLQKSELRYRSIVESQLEWVCRFRADGELTFANSALCQATDKPFEQLVGEKFLALVTDDGRETVLRRLASLNQADPIGRIDCRVMLANGKVGWRRWSLQALFDAPGHFVEFQATSWEISPPQPVEPSRQSAQAAEFDLQQVHQYLNTTLQHISNLICLQAWKVEDSLIAASLLDCQDRISMMARVHNQLYLSENLVAIDMGDYIKRLIPELFKIYSNDNTIIRLEVDADDISLDVNLAILCASILCELVSNVIIHAFPTHRDFGEIRVSLTSKADHDLTLKVSDNGVGLPPDFDIQKLRTIGLVLVDSLVKQLEGTMTIEGSQGNTFEINF